MKTGKRSTKTATSVKSAELPPSTNLLDYPESLSLYERESRAAEAKLAERKADKRRRKAA